MIVTDFIKALGQLGDSRFQRVVLLGLGLTIALLFAIYAGFLMLIDWADPSSLELPIVGQITWLGDLLSWGSLLLMIVMSMFLMVPVASAITSFFLDDVAQAVEDKHYAHLPTVPHVSFWDGVKDTVNFMGVLIVGNILALVLAALLPFFAVPIFYALNGFLLGREYFTLAAMRREGRERARALQKENMIEIWVAGCLMALPLSLPLVNLIIPVLGAASFTHMYHRLARR